MNIVQIQIAYINTNSGVLLKKELLNVIPYRLGQ